MSNVSYEATIYYDVYIDDYNEGEGKYVNSWTDTIQADTVDQMKSKLANAMNCEWEDINHDDINNYDYGSEYYGGYTSDNDNEPATTQMIDKWRKGEMTLYAVNCLAVVSKVTKDKVILK